MPGKKWFVEDWVGKQFPGTVWTVLGETEVNPKRRKWLCECSCGFQNQVGLESLQNSSKGKSGSSGCWSCGRVSAKESVQKWKLSEYQGKVFPGTQWTVLKQDCVKTGGRHYWLCECKCGELKSKSVNSLVFPRSGGAQCKKCADSDKRGTGKRITGSGYIELTKWSVEHPEYITRQNGKGSIFEHVYVMACYLGRPLLPNENVHHINGQKDDNRLENLELWTSSQPSGQRVSDLLAWADEITELYKNDRNKILSTQKE